MARPTGDNTEYQYVNTGDPDYGVLPPPPPPPPAEVDLDGLIVSPGASDLAVSIVAQQQGFVEMAWQSDPHRVLWCLRSDGILWGLTYRRRQNVFAWHRHPMKGASVKSICVIPGGASGEDQLWLVVQRTVNGVTVRHVEVMQSPHVPQNLNDSGDFWHLDCALKYDGAATEELSGLEHLEGETVSIWADGARHADKTVADGKVTLDRSVTKAVVGLYSRPLMATLPLEGGAYVGTAQGKMKRVTEARIRVYESDGLQTGRDADNLISVDRRVLTDAMDAGTPLASGWYPVTLNTGYARDGSFVISQDGGAPLTVIAVQPVVDTVDA